MDRYEQYDESEWILTKEELEDIEVFKQYREQDAQVIVNTYYVKSERNKYGAFLHEPK